MCIRDRINLSYKQNHFKKRVYSVTLERGYGHADGITAPFLGNKLIFCQLLLYTVWVLSLIHILTDRIDRKVRELEDVLISLHSAKDIGEESAMIRDTVLVKMSELRIPCDEAETLTAKSYWPFPTYADLLFGVK